MRYGASLLLVVAAVVVPALSIHAGPGKALVANGFALLIGTSGFLNVAIGLAGMVTHFQLTEGMLTFSRLGRRARTVNLSEVAAVNEETSATSGSTIWLRDGTTLYVPFDDLSNARELIAELCTPRSHDHVLEGCLIRSAVAGTLVYQWLLSCILLAISFVGGMCILIYFKPNNILPRPTSMLLLGSALLALCAAGLYFLVLRHWLGCVRSFRWDGECLQYRTVFSRTLQQRHVEEVESASARRPSSSRGESSSWRIVRFHDGDRLKLHFGTLQNADELFVALKTAVDRRASIVLPGSLPPVTSDHPLWPAIEPQMEEGERVLWLGQPVCRKLLSEMSAEMIFGLIPGSFGIGFSAMGWHLAVNRGDKSGWTAIPFGLLFSGIGAWMMAAPWRYRRMLRDTVYAVTSQRVLILNGLLWGSRSAVQRRGLPVEVFGPDEARLFEVVGRRRDIILGGTWKRGRRGSRLWVNFGFLAADDPKGAEVAIRYLLSMHPSAVS